MHRLGLKLAQGKGSTGSGFHCALATIHSIGPHKQREKAVVRLKDGNVLVAVGSWKKIRARWKALKEGV